MEKVKKRKGDDSDVKLGLKDERDWSEDEMAKIKSFIKKRNSNLSEESRLKNDLLALKYQMEDYVNDERAKKAVHLEEFLSAYLEILDLTLKKFAQSIDTTDANLKKYISGDRKFNTDLALKFANFFHTKPELWLRVYMKNELLALSKEKHSGKYRKYDYEKVLD